MWWGALALTLAAVGVARASGTAGAVDIDFGTGGIVTDAPGFANDVVVRSDGRILAVGSAPSGILIGGRETTVWLVRRYLDDGSLDTSFGTGGFVTLFGQDLSERATVVALDASGRILVGGNGSVQVTSGSGKKQTTTTQRGGVVARLAADGSLDATFGDGGVAFLELGEVDGLAVTTGGRVLAAGTTKIQTSSGGKRHGGSTQTSAIFVARLNDDGTRDASYGANGIATVNLVASGPVGDEFLRAKCLAAQPDGAVVLGADLPGAGIHWALVKLDSDGMFDSSFGTVTQTGASLRALAGDETGSLYATGVDASGCRIVAYDADGAVESDFGSGGSARIALSSYEPAPGGLVLASGSVTVVGLQWQADGSLAVVTLRLLSDGALDPSFGDEGIGELLTDGSAGGIAATGAAPSPEGDLVVVGVENAAIQHWVLGRMCGG